MEILKIQYNYATLKFKIQLDILSYIHYAVVGINAGKYDIFVS